MGNKALTIIYGETSKNVKKVATENNDPTIGLFIDHNTYPDSGLITVTQRWVQNFNWYTGLVAAVYYSDSNIVQVDWNLESDSGSVIVIGTADGKIKIMNTSDLEIVSEISINDCFSDDIPQITALSCTLERDLIVGFSNGATMSFNAKEGRQNHLFIGKGFFDELEVPPPVDHIRASCLDRLIFITYADYTIQNNKVKRLPSSLILIFNWDTGEYVRQANLPKMSIINIGVVEDQKLLIMMTRGENSLFFLDYTSWKGVAKLGDLPSSQMFVFPFSKAMVEAQMNLYHQAIDADALIYTANDDGCICSGLIASTKDNEELQWTWIPQHLYSTKQKETDHKESGLKILNTIWYNVILDILIVSDVSGVVYLIENTFYYTLKNNLKVPIKSDIKQPFFSIGLSQSSKESIVAWLTKEKHVKKEHEEKEKSSSLPLFSLGIFKSSNKENNDEEVKKDKRIKDENKEESKVIKPVANRKRVQINKNDILSGKLIHKFKIQNI